MAAQTGISTRMLRYYENEGLLEPERHPNGYRDFDQHTITVVEQIKALRAAGLTTKTIRELLPCATGSAPELEPCPELLQTLQTQLTHLDQQATALQRTRNLLANYLHKSRRTADT